MPNRLLRDGICTSDALNSLSADAEVMFYRLLVVADDYGYMDARLPILKAQCFPLKESATQANIETWLSELAERGLIARYQKDGQPLLAVAKWEQRVRSRQKYAGPTDEGCQSTASQPPANVGQVADNGQTVDAQLSDRSQSSDRLGRGKGWGKGRGARSRPRRGLRSLPEDWTPSPATIERLTAQFKFSNGDAERYAQAFRDACKSKGYEYKDFDAAFANCVVQDWPKFRAGKDTMPERPGTQLKVAL